MSEMEKKINAKTMDEETARFYKFLGKIFATCEKNGFHLEERIVVKDIKTGKVWR